MGVEPEDAEGGCMRGSGVLCGCARTMGTGLPGSAEPKRDPREVCSVSIPSRPWPSHEALAPVYIRALSGG